MRTLLIAISLAIPAWTIPALAQGQATKQDQKKSAENQSATQSIQQGDKQAPSENQTNDKDKQSPEKTPETGNATGAAQQAQSETPPKNQEKATNTTTAPANPHNNSAGSNDDLMAELQAAASADQATLAKQRGQTASGSGGSLFGKREDERQLGKETVGNETNPAISLILDTAAAYFSQHDRLKMGGHAPTGNGPMVQGAELAISAPIDPFLRVDLNHGLYHGHVEEVYFTTTALPWNLKLRGGKFKANVGRQNPRHLHQWDFVVHPIANQFLFGAEGLSLPGAEVSWLTPLPWYVELIGSVQIGESGSFRTRPNEEENIGVKDLIYPVRLVQFFDVGDDWGLQLGLNTVQGTSPMSPEKGNRTEAYGADLFLKWRPIGPGHTGFVYFKLTSEGWYRKIQVPGDLWKDAGGYTDLVFGLGKEWNAGLRGEVWRRLNGQGLQNNPFNRAQYGMNVVRGSAQVSYMPSHFSRVRAQYSLEKSELYPTNQIFLLQVEVAAGSHGAHQY